VASIARVARYAAFLRGVNVGGVNLKMADVAAALSAAGFGSVRTGATLDSAVGATMSRPRYKPSTTTRNLRTLHKVLRQRVDFRRWNAYSPESPRPP
jgi:uncharacterized protein (DUF1697 family)